MKGYRTETHDILIEFEGDGLALAEEVRRLRGVLANVYVVKPFEWEEYNGAAFAKIAPAWVVNVYPFGDRYMWEIDTEIYQASGKANSLLDGKMKAFEAWSGAIGWLLEEVEL